jgi:3-isopropylmalate/(R)-2-methylmalate dehydratase small subunit
MAPIRQIHSRTVVLPYTNIDTDQIIPARFLRTTTHEGLGQQLFTDWRRHADGTLNMEFPLNRPEAAGCSVLVADRNFGCGSSREHAPWALLDYGFQAVISSEIADIFRNNSLKNGLLPIVVDPTVAQWLLEHPGADVTIDLTKATLELPTGAIINFPIEAFARFCLLNGLDELGFLLAQEQQIGVYEKRRQA